jgi:hypothetical protein
MAGAPIVVIPHPRDGVLIHAPGANARHAATSKPLPESPFGNFFVHYQ